MIREPGDLPGRAEWPLFVPESAGLRLRLHDRAKTGRRDPCRSRAAGIFLLRTADSGAPNLRSNDDRPGFGVQTQRLNAKSLRLVSWLAGSPVLLRLAIGATALLTVGLALILTATSVGPYTIPPSRAVEILLEGLGFGRSSASDTERAIIVSIRMPRIILALIVGAALGVSGAVMQGLFRNPMADPGIIGVSAGGALGAVIAIATGASALVALALPAMSFAGAAATLVVVYIVASVGGRFSMAALLLAGVAIGAFIAAVISAIILFTANLQAQREMLFWLAGGLGASTWEDVRLSAPFVLLGIAVSVMLSRDLNLLMLSDEEARALGARVALTRNSLLIATSLITGAAVAFSGTIAFVGLIAPHTLRLIVGADHRVLIPLSAIGGGVFLLAADILSRTVIDPAEVPVGVVTALTGAPFFLALLARNKARASML